MKRLAAGGFKDITRIASSSPVMWEQICMTNTENILTLLKRYIDEPDSDTAELLRGAIQAVPRGEIEAARALGLPRFTQLRDIILPRALRIALPGYGNEIILLLKASALASTITLLDLMGATRGAISRTYMSLEFLLLAGVLYLIVAVLLIAAFRSFEYFINHHRRIAGSH